MVLEPGTDPVPRLSAINLDSVESVSTGVLIDRLGRLIRSLDPLLQRSDAGRVGNAREVVYSGTKAAVMASTKALALEFARYGIRVNAVSPGPVQQTELLSGLFEGEIGEKIARLVPLRRLGQPQEVADVVAFFCSDDSRYLTGQVLSVDGGLTMIG